jgi:flagellar basal-body rod modification protein FlgD
VIDPVASGYATGGSEASNPLSQLGSYAFLKLLVAQLKYQNPMEPNDGAAMLQQTAQFTTVETLQSIAAMNQQLMGFQQVTMGLGLVGKSVDAIGLNDLPVSGTVESMRFTVDGPVLVLDGGETIPMTNVISVTAADSDTAEPAPPPPIVDPAPGS